MGVTLSTIGRSDLDTEHQEKMLNMCSPLPGWCFDWLEFALAFATAHKHIHSPTMALSLYRRILRVAQTWEGGFVEQAWIRAEARRRFEENRALVDPTAIDEAVQQGHNQVDVALHYKICYPRPQYADPGTLGGESDFHRQSSRANTRLGRLHKSKVQNQFRSNKR